MDFRILAPDGDASVGDPTHMRIMLAAAHRATVAGHLAAAKAGGLTVTAVDIGGLALLRSLDLASQIQSGSRAIVAVGSDLTTVAVTAGGDLSFMRVLAGGADRWSEAPGIGDALTAGGITSRRPPGTSGPTSTEEVEALVGEIAASLDYFASLGDLSGLEQVWLTGSGSKYLPLVDQLQQTLRYEVLAADPLSQVDVDGSKLTADELAGAVPFIQTALGLACWQGKGSVRRLTLLPPELLRARQEHRAKSMVGATGVALLAALVGGWYLRSHDATEVHSRIAAVAAQSAVKQAAISRLDTTVSYFAAVDAGAGTVKQLEAGNVDWPSLVNEIAKALPPGLNLSDLTFGASNGTVATSSSPSGQTAGTPPAGTGDTVGMNVSGPGGEDEVAVFLRALERVPALSGVWVPSAVVASGSVTFTASATLNGAAPQVQRGGTK